MAEGEVHELVDLLTRAPLRMLVLDGLDTASSSLLEHIAAVLPGLVGLTLQLSRGAGRWPGTAEAYAAALTGCPLLEYFGWNYQLVSSASPAAMLHFEEGFCGRGCVHTEAIEATFDEAEDLTRLFARHCPTLRYLTFRKKRSIFLNALCRIARDSQGRVVVEVDRTADDDDWIRGKFLAPPPRYHPESGHAWPLLNDRPSELNYGAL